MIENWPLILIKKLKAYADRKYIIASVSDVTELLRFEGFCAQILTAATNFKTIQKALCYVSFVHEKSITPMKSSLGVQLFVT
ncbi:CLUMA_CG015648, isoform A [Clunio marinus]|uniref:CLUMA_CG015648, isoform A n=1 Tax=Clunio marinus TaxID=568069 RepID=A0A1J1IUW1_9DIPT|nr:CLUMA_CG015648, isoform A [Clunio marinus]